MARRPSSEAVPCRSVPTRVLWIVVTPIAGQAPVAGRFPPYRAPRAADGHADLNGIWQALVSANWDLLDHEAQSGPHPEITGAYGAGPAGQSIVEGNPDRRRLLELAELLHPGISAPVVANIWMRRTPIEPSRFFAQLEQGAWLAVSRKRPPRVT